MKRFSMMIRMLVPALVIMLITGACGTKATPTANPIDIQGTLLAAASTSVAETQTAIPTATPQPTATITNTPAPTLTLPPMPTFDPALTQIPSGNSTSVSADPCINKVLPDTLPGQPIKIRIDNPTKATLMVSVYLLQAGPQSQCGYRGYSLAPQQSLVINDLVEGCYTVWAWNPDPEGYFMVTNGTDCLDTSNSWTFDISTSSIKLRP